MVATNLAALLPKIVALTLLSLPSDHELCVTYTIFKDSSTELKATKFTQCQSTEITSGTPAGVFKKGSAHYKLLQLYPVNTALDSILFSRLVTADDGSQLSGLSLLNVSPGEPKLLISDMRAKEARVGVANGHAFYQDCGTEDTMHIDMVNVGKEVNRMSHEGLIICGKPEFGQTKDGSVWTKFEGCWTLDGDNLKPSDRSDVTELVFTIEALVNMDPTIAQDVDQADLKTMLVLVHSQLAPQTTCTTTTPADDTTSLDVAEDIFVNRTTFLERHNRVVFWGYFGIIASFLSLVIVVVCIAIWCYRNWKGLAELWRQRHTTGSDVSSTSAMSPPLAMPPPPERSPPLETSPPVLIRRHGTAPQRPASLARERVQSRPKAAKTSASSGTSTNTGSANKKRGKSKKEATPKVDESKKLPGQYVSIESVLVPTKSGKHTTTEIREQEISRG
ncbi:unnamed protein product [Bursaphelenchus okinawaensis]|uniref:Uncharacterized protein n=1 Tax=Bursaphelenchus okinawaensis TaxID=465554 RepID=A0A811KD30_9BILA|nr:unnamed protein product [Bursaphelenchus okinawaensis]CAG9101385.1 unnamed protein product [Bursaphelenchus okinawaensis]